MSNKWGLFKTFLQRKELNGPMWCFRSSEDPQGWMGYFGNALKTSATYLPSQVTEVFKQGRDFAVARLPCPGLKNVCALAT